MAADGCCRLLPELRTRRPSGWLGSLAPNVVMLASHLTPLTTCSAPRARPRCIRPSELRLPLRRSREPPARVLIVGKDCHFPLPSHQLLTSVLSPLPSVIAFDFCFGISQHRQPDSTTPSRHHFLRQQALISRVRSFP